MLEEKDLNFVVQRSGVMLYQAHNVIEMLDEGMSVPFISRYRKERTGSLDEVKIHLVQEWYEYSQELNDRKSTVLKTILEQGKLTEELRKKIEDTFSKVELEDIYLPFKPKRRTKATIAKEKGLEPLAVSLLDENIPGTPEELAPAYISEEKGVNSIEEALEGAGHIIAEWFSENAAVRKMIRTEMAEKGIMVVTVTDDWKEQRTKFEQYYDYKEPVRSIPSHRFLAMRRGEHEKVLSMHLEIEKEPLLAKIALLLYNYKHVRLQFLDEVLKDSFQRLIFPSVESDILSEHKHKSDEEAIEVFAENLRKLLLSPGAGNTTALGVDPGFRTGCKLVVLDETGKLLDMTTIFPTKPQENIEESTKVVNKLIEKYSIKTVAIGNGTASRETYAFFKHAVPENIIVSVVNESGASIYSASEAAREEFPDHDVTVRGSVSIGRRFQDPLAELVKIDPKSIGVGQYQHDVNQSSLKKKLDNVVISVVNLVGVELNTASYHLLRYVSGIGEVLAKNIVKYRDKHGMFQNRDSLYEVSKFGERAFQQSAGFLRIPQGENVLDSTGIHPESYKIVTRMAESLSKNVTDLIRNKTLLSKLNPEQFVTDTFGIPTIKDIIEELENPGRDPRKDFEIFEFNEEVMEFEHVKVDMILKGVITNVTRFGAFVDIGVHQDALIHISELANKFIRSPEEVVSVGDKIKAKVIKVDPELKRIHLSIKALKPTPPPPRDRKKAPTYDDGLAQLKKKWE